MLRSARPRPARLPLVALSALAGTAALILVTELLPVGLLPEMGRSLGVTDGRVGFLATAYAVSATAGAIPLTALTCGLPRRPLLVGLLAGFAVANAVTAASSSYWLTFGARVLVGLLGGLTWSMLAGYAARLVRAEQRGRAIAVALSGVTIALALGLPAATAVATWTGWRGSFAILSAGAIGLAGWVRWTVPGRPGVAAVRTPLVRVVRLPGVTLVLGTTATFLLGHQAMYTFLAPYAERAGFDRPGGLLLTFGLSAVAGIWLTGLVVDRAPRAVTGAAVGLVAAALLALGLSGASAGVLLVAVALWGLAFGGLPTALLSGLVRAAGEANADTAGSLQTTVYNIGVAGGSLIGGLALDGLGVAALPWIALPLVLSALALTTLSRGSGKS